jgi:hypothetical protein
MTNNEERKAVIIAGFPGVGKSHCVKECPDKMLDLDSSSFSWVMNSNGEKTRNPDFPENYIDAIEKASHDYKVIFVSTHEDVVKGLSGRRIGFIVVHPDISLKEEYLQRYRDRKSPQNFIDLLDANWDTWINDFERSGVRRYILSSGQHVSNFIKRFLARDLY